MKQLDYAKLAAKHSPAAGAGDFIAELTKICGLSENDLIFDNDGELALKTSIDGEYRYVKYRQLLQYYNDEMRNR